MQRMSKCDNAKAQDAQRFRTIASGNGYSGLTAIPSGPGKEIVVMGTGVEVEAMLVERLAYIGEVNNGE